MNCDPNALLDAAKCFRCIPSGSLESVMTYELAVIAGGSMDPRQLVREAIEFVKIPPIFQQAVKVKLWCDILDELD